MVERTVRQIAEGASVAVSWLKVFVVVVVVVARMVVAVLSS